MTTSSKTSETTATSRQWLDAIAKLNDWLENEYDESGQDLFIEEIRYEPERNRLAVEFEDQFVILFGFDVECNWFCAAAWKDNSLDACLNGRGCGEPLDEDSLKVLEITYLLPCEAFEKGKRTLVIYDSFRAMDFATPSQTAVFIHLMEQLLWFGEIHPEPPFQLGKILEYSKMQRTLVDTLEVLRGRMLQPWIELSKEWDSTQER